MNWQSIVELEDRAKRGTAATLVVCLLGLFSVSAEGEPKRKTKSSRQAVVIELSAIPDTATQDNKNFKQIDCKTNAENAVSVVNKNGEVKSVGPSTQDSLTLEAHGYQSFTVEDSNNSMMLETSLGELRERTYVLQRPNGGTRYFVLSSGKEVSLRAEC